MGVFYSGFTVRNEDGDPSLELEAMVDTGASFTIIPSILLQSIGIRPHRTVSMKLADGRPVEYPLGRAWITLGTVRQRLPWWHLGTITPSPSWARTLLNPLRWQRTHTTDGSFLPICGPRPRPARALVQPALPIATMAEE